MPFVVLCASCAYSPSDTADEGTVTCELVQQRVFATREEAGMYARDLWRSPATWGHPQRSPHDVIRVAEVAAADAKNLDQAVRQLTEDAELRRQLKHVYKVWISGKNPYAVTLAEARAYSGADAVAVLEGDHGGQTYVVCPVPLIHCDEATLKRLLLAIDAQEWPGQPEMAQLAFLRAAVGENFGGGMGGGLVTEGIWVHRRLRARGLERRIAAVLADELPTIE